MRSSIGVFRYNLKLALLHFVAAPGKQILVPKYFTWNRSIAMLSPHPRTTYHLTSSVQAEDEAEALKGALLHPICYCCATVKPPPDVKLGELVTFSPLKRWWQWVFICAKDEHCNRSGFMVANERSQRRFSNVCLLDLPNAFDLHLNVWPPECVVHDTDPLSCWGAIVTSRWTV